MKQSLIAYGTTLAVFCLVDFTWLGLVAKGFYRSQVGTLLLDAPNWSAAIPFYLLYVLGIVVFAISPALSVGSLLSVVVRGALFGLIAYGTYDLTNLATLKGWTTALVIADMLWGTLLTGLAAGAGYWAASPGGR